MTESSDVPPPVVNPVAAKLALELGGFNKISGIPDDFPEALTPEQQAMIADTFGLLNGIGFGTVTTAQPRISDNLVKVISSLQNSASTGTSTHLVQALTGILSRASTAGLTAENQTLRIRTSLRNR